MVRVLFVCLGNICRSPTAEGVFRALVDSEGLGGEITVDSAGTHAYHIGEGPDSRSQAAAALRGIDLSPIRGRRATAADIEDFDYVLAMDQDNYDNLMRLTPPEYESRVSLLMAYAPERSEDEVPDPYFGGEGGFDRVLDMIEDASRGLLADIRRQHNI